MNVTNLAPSATIDTTNATNINTGWLNGSLLTSVNSSFIPLNSNKSFGSSSSSPIFTVDYAGRVIMASSSPINISYLNVQNLAPSATIDTTNATNINTGWLNGSLLTSVNSSFIPLYSSKSFGSSSSSPIFTVDYTGRVICLLYTSPSPRDRTRSRMPSSA